MYVYISVRSSKTNPILFMENQENQNQNQNQDTKKEKATKSTQKVAENIGMSVMAGGIFVAGIFTGWWANS